MIEARFIIGSDAMDLSGPIRYEVFTLGQGVSPEIERDLYDHFAHHVVVCENDEPLATGRLILKDEQFLIGRIAVLESERGKQYGDLVVRMLVDRAFSIGAKEVLVHSQLQVQKFYEKIGFKVYGDIFLEAGIEHVHMSIRSNDLIIPCSKH